MNKLEPITKLVQENKAKDGFKSIKNSKTNSEYSKKTPDRVTLSDKSKNNTIAKNSKNKTGEIRHDLVTKYRKILENGNYSIKADEIAEKIVQKIRDNKNHLAL